MTTTWLKLAALAAPALLFGAAPAFPEEVPSGTPEATIDLATADGVHAVAGAWRYSDTRITETEFRAPGPDLKPSGPPNRTYDYAPHAGAADFDDSGWTIVEPAALAARRSTGKLCFAWYRLNVTVPRRVGEFDPSGSTLVFETDVDDYAEVWVDGKLPRALGQSGGTSSGAGTRPTGSSSGATCGPAKGSSSRCSRSTGRSRTRRPTTSGCARRGSISTGRCRRPPR